MAYSAWRQFQADAHYILINTLGELIYCDRCPCDVCNYLVPLGAFIDGVDAGSTGVDLAMTITGPWQTGAVSGTITVTVTALDPCCPGDDPFVQVDVEVSSDDTAEAGLDIAIVFDTCTGDAMESHIINFPGTFNFTEVFLPTQSFCCSGIVQTGFSFIEFSGLDLPRADVQWTYGDCPPVDPIDPLYFVGPDDGGGFEVLNLIFES